MVVELRDASGLGERFSQCTFDNWEEVKGTEEAVRRCMDFARTYKAAVPGVQTVGDGKGLILTGGAGSGKSHLAAAVLNVLLGRGVECRFVSVPVLMAQIRRRFEGKGDDEGDPIEPLLTAEVLVLDDAGAEKSSEWTQERIYEVVDTRYRRLRSTILTTNLPPAELEKAIGSRSMDRLLQTCKLVKLNAASYRRRVADGH